MKFGAHRIVYTARGAVLYFIAKLDQKFEVGYRTL
jgi:hypothetical protein